MDKTDSQLKRDIEDELRCDPRVNAAQIGVTVNHGAVSLLGDVDTYAEKWAAEDATRRVSGVRAVAQDLKVIVLTEHSRDDSEIATIVQDAFHWNVCIPKHISADVKKGEITLRGDATWHYERDAAERAVRYIPGVVAVHNYIALKPEASADQVKEKVLAALHRQAGVDAASIHVETLEGNVILTGHASSWQSIADATEAAWAAPGVTNVAEHVKLHIHS